MNASPDRLAKDLKYSFSRPERLEEALTHSSLSLDQTPNLASNQRLEFLGDRVLGLVVAQLFCERFPDEEEGALARRHAELVRKETLARVAGLIDLGGYIRMSHGDEEAGGRENPAILADACEAVIAALYVDGGLEAASAFIQRYWTALMEEDLTPPKDAKTALQEWAQARGLPVPDYREISRDGPPHAPTFVIEVLVSGEEPQTGTGPSKRTAEQMAAQELLGRVEDSTDG